MPLRRLAALLVAALLSSAASAATVLERSPFAQGFWWTPGQPGSGFEMFNANGQAMVTWYTYEQSGRAVWYTAQGTVASLGDSWPLLKHRWVNGRKAEPTVVGSLKLVVKTAESAEIRWELDGRSGAYGISPFIQSGVVNEVDHSGTWFDPANSGWGLSLLEQGDVLGGALFTYTPDGEPTWAAGFERGGGGATLSVSTGACPGCDYRSPSMVSAGRLEFGFGGEASLVLRNRLSLAMAPGINAENAALVQLSRAASVRAADRQLARFDDASLKAYLDVGMFAVPFYSGPGDFSPAPAGTSAPFSPTNLQEPGVDEAALVKTNGEMVFTYTYDSFGRRQPNIRVARVTENGAKASGVGTFPIGGGELTMVGNAGLLVYGDKLVTVHGTQAVGNGYSPWASSSAWARGRSQVELYGPLSSGGIPALRWRAEIDGYLVATRRIGSKLYVVSRYAPYIQGFSYTYPGSSAAADTANRQLLAQTPLPDLLPKVRINGITAPLLGAGDVYSPPHGTRPPSADMIVVTVVDLEFERIAQSIGIAGVVETVYASPNNLVLATTRYDVRGYTGGLLPEPPFARTDLHQIALRENGMTIVGSGPVEGILDSNLDKAPFRLSEYQGRIRAVTTNRAGLWGAENVNRVTVMEPSTVAPGLLKTVGFLPNANRPETLGKRFEALYGTRFVGDRLYAVTFRVVDPLYVVDLSSAADPKIAGSLSVPGFSDYLHPLPGNLLLGFGKDAKPVGVDFGNSVGDGQAAWYQGLQVSLFDVSDAGKPKQIHRIDIGKRGSNSALLASHHALSVLPRADGLQEMAIPVRVHEGTTPEYGSGDSAFYPWQYSGLLRFEVRGTSGADAYLQELPTLVTHSRGGGLTAFEYQDPGAVNGRSIIFPAGTLYVGMGQFWHRDSEGRVNAF